VVPVASGLEQVGGFTHFECYMGFVQCHMLLMRHAVKWCVAQNLFECEIRNDAERERHQCVRCQDWVRRFCLAGRLHAEDFIQSCTSLDTVAPSLCAAASMVV